jgi:hypothetical protein
MDKVVEALSHYETSIATKDHITVDVSGRKILEGETFYWILATTMLEPSEPRRLAKFNCMLTSVSLDSFRYLADNFADARIRDRFPEFITNKLDEEELKIFMDDTYMQDIVR